MTERENRSTRSVLSSCVCVDVKSTAVVVVFMSTVNKAGLQLTGYIETVVFIYQTVVASNLI